MLFKGGKDGQRGDRCVPDASQSLFYCWLRKERTARRDRRGVNVLSTGGKDGQRGDRRVLKAPPRIEILSKEKRTARRGTASSKLPKV